LRCRRGGSGSSGGCLLLTLRFLGCCLLAGRLRGGLLLRGFSRCFLRCLVGGGLLGSSLLSSGLFGSNLRCRCPRIRQPFRF
jgi:hypothetical protein